MSRLSSSRLFSQKVLIRPSDYLPHVYVSMRFGNDGVAALEPAAVGIVGCGYLGPAQVGFPSRRCRLLS